jgi:hypothetical protein
LDGLLFCGGAHWCAITNSFDGILPSMLNFVIDFTKNGAWRMTGSRKRFYVCCMCVLILSYAMLSVAGMGIALPL